MGPRISSKSRSARSTSPQRTHASRTAFMTMVLSNPPPRTRHRAASTSAMICAAHPRSALSTAKKKIEQCNCWRSGSRRRACEANLGELPAAGEADDASSEAAEIGGQRDVPGGKIDPLAPSASSFGNGLELRRLGPLGRTRDASAGGVVELEEQHERLAQPAPVVWRRAAGSSRGPGLRGGCCRVGGAGCSW